MKLIKTPIEGLIKVELKGTGQILQGDHTMNSWQRFFPITNQKMFSFSFTCNIIHVIFTHFIVKIVQHTGSSTFMQSS